LSGAGHPPLTQGVLGGSTSTLSVSGSIPSTPSAGGLAATNSFSGSSEASTTDIPTGLTLGLRHLHVSVYLLTLIAAPIGLQPPPVTGNQAGLVLSLDTNGGIMLTTQQPLVRMVIQDSFDILCASLVFINAFPNAPLAVQFVKDALLSSCYVLGLTQGAFFIFHLLTKPFPSRDQPPIHLDHMTNHLTSHLTTHITKSHAIPITCSSKSPVLHHLLPSHLHIT